MLSILLAALFLGGADLSDSVRLRQAGVAEFQLGHYGKAEESIRKALDSAESISDGYEAALDYAALGEVQHAERLFSEAERSYRKAISLLGSELNQGSNWSHKAAMVWEDLAGTLMSETRFDDALDAAKEASRLAAKSQLDDSCLNAQILNSFGVIYYRQKKMDKAESAFVRAAAVQFAPYHPLDVDRWQILNNLGRVYQITRQHDKAAEAYRRSLQLAKVRVGPSHPALTVVLLNLGSMYAAAGRYPEAEAEFQNSLSILEHSKTSFDSVVLMRTLYGLGQTYLRQNDFSRANDMLARAAEIARRHAFGIEMPEVAEILDTYAEALEGLSNVAEAQLLRTEARRIRASLAYTVSVSNAK